MLHILLSISALLLSSKSTEHYLCELKSPSFSLMTLKTQSKHDIIDKYIKLWANGSCFYFKSSKENFLVSLQQAEVENIQKTIGHQSHRENSKHTKECDLQSFTDDSNIIITTH